MYFQAIHSIPQDKEYSATPLKKETTAKPDMSQPSVLRDYFFK